MEKLKNSQESNISKKQKKNKCLLLLLLLLALIIGGIWCFFSHQLSKFDANAHSYNDPIKKGATWTPGQLIFPGFGEVPVGINDKEIKITLGNSKINEAYFKYKVVVEQEGKDITILDTKLIKPGDAITEISTEKLTMKKGSYPMTITTNAYSLKNKKVPLNGSMVDAILIIN
ncbi:FHA domain-containing protein [Enterococcus faecium]|uniref:hypothetical protein n=1 Tax=Enterococcus faecium TaxID=1352 RepID=UPI0006B2804C|nr:hypothetical protein [Enterococcus faecium]